MRCQSIISVTDTMWDTLSGLMSDNCLQTSVIWEWQALSMSGCHLPSFLWFENNFPHQCLAVIWFRLLSMWFVFWRVTVRICHLICFIQSVTIFPNLNMRPYLRLNHKKVWWADPFPYIIAILPHMIFCVCPYLNLQLLSLDGLTLLFVSLSLFLNLCLTLLCTFH